MAAVFLLPLFLQVSLSLPISLHVKTVQSTDSVPESGLTERTSVLSSETVLRITEDKKPVQSLSTETLLKAFESFEADHGKRIKRENIKPLALCPKDTYQYGTRCLTQEEFEENGLEGSDDDYEAKR